MDWPRTCIMGAIRCLGRVEALTFIRCRNVCKCLIDIYVTEQLLLDMHIYIGSHAITAARHRPVTPQRWGKALICVHSPQWLVTLPNVKK